jgi:hypothetical protein
MRLNFSCNLNVSGVYNYLFRVFVLFACVISVHVASFLCDDCVYDYDSVVGYFVFSIMIVIDFIVALLSLSLFRRLFIAFLCLAAFDLFSHILFNMFLVIFRVVGSAGSGESYGFYFYGLLVSYFVTLWVPFLISWLAYKCYSKSVRFSADHAAA